MGSIGSEASRKSRARTKAKFIEVRERLKAEGKSLSGAVTLKIKCVKCNTLQEVRVSSLIAYTEDVKKTWVCPYCRFGVCKPGETTKEKTAKAPRVKTNRKSVSGESILIEIMLKGFCSREKLVDETGLSPNSIKMYTNGYLERVRHKPYRIVCKGDNQFKLVKMEE